VSSIDLLQVARFFLGDKRDVYLLIANGALQVKQAACSAEPATILFHASELRARPPQSERWNDLEQVYVKHCDWLRAIY